MFPNPLHKIKGLFTIMQNHFLAATNSEKKVCDLRDILLRKVSRRSLFLRIGKCHRKWFFMVINNSLWRGLGNIAKAYLIKCGQSIYSKLKNMNFAETLTCKCPYALAITRLFFFRKKYCSWCPMN